MTSPLDSDETEQLRRDFAAAVAAHDLMAAQFRTMRAEKEHGWQVAEDLAEQVLGLLDIAENDGVAPVSEEDYLTLVEPLLETARNILGHDA